MSWIGDLPQASAGGVRGRPLGMCVSMYFAAAAGRLVR